MRNQPRVSGQVLMDVACEAMERRPDLTEAIRAQIRILTDGRGNRGRWAAQTPAEDHAMVELRRLVMSAGVRWPL